MESDDGEIEYQNLLKDGYETAPRAEVEGRDGESLKVR